MRNFNNSSGTSKTSFYVGIKKWLIDAAAATVLRTLTLGNRNIDFSSGSTGDVLQILSSTSVGWGAGGGGSGTGIVTRGGFRSGNAVVETQATAPILMSQAGTITGIRTYVRTAPVGASLIVDVLKNGVSVYPTSAKPTITSGTNLSSVAVPDTTTIAAGDIFEISITQIGSTTAGADLLVNIDVQT
jgi:hypothetical protein